MNMTYTMAMDMDMNMDMEFMGMDMLHLRAFGESVEMPPPVALSECSWACRHVNVRMCWVTGVSACDECWVWDSGVVQLYVLLLGVRALSCGGARDGRRADA